MTRLFSLGELETTHNTTAACVCVYRGFRGTIWGVSVYIGVPLFRETILISPQILSVAYTKPKPRRRSDSAVDAGGEVPRSSVLVVTGTSGQTGQ